MPSSSRIGRALPEARERRDEKPLLPERRPVALRVLDQLVGFRDPERPAAALEPVIEQDPCRLPSLARPGAVAKKEAAAEADRLFRVIGRGADFVEALINRPRAGEMAGMGFAGMDDALELGLGENAFRDKPRGQMRTV